MELLKIPHVWKNRIIVISLNQLVVDSITKRVNPGRTYEILLSSLLSGLTFTMYVHAWARVLIKLPSLSQVDLVL